MTRSVVLLALFTLVCCLCAEGADYCTWCRRWSDDCPRIDILSNITDYVIRSELGFDRYMKIIANGTELPYRIYRDCTNLRKSIVIVYNDKRMATIDEITLLSAQITGLHTASIFDCSMEPSVLGWDSRMTAGRPVASISWYGVKSSDSYRILDENDMARYYSGDFSVWYGPRFMFFKSSTRESGVDKEITVDGGVNFDEDDLFVIYGQNPVIATARPSPYRDDDWMITIVNEGKHDPMVVLCSMILLLYVIRSGSTCATLYTSFYSSVTAFAALSSLCFLGYPFFGRFPASILYGFLTRWRIFHFLRTKKERFYQEELRHGSGRRKKGDDSKYVSVLDDGGPIFPELEQDSVEAATEDESGTFTPPEVSLKNSD